MFWLILMLIFHSLSAQKNHLARGVVLDSIPVTSDSTETYALYLPTNYNPKEPSPIVFIFHPAAQGRYGIEPFIPASEAYGYVLICSNNSRNGPYKLNFEIATRLFAIIFDSFKIDERRIYLAGFSGGSRLASSIALLTRQFRGVVACGAGLVSNQAHFQLAELEDFSYAAIIGDEDMNYRELINTSRWLTKLNVSNELFEYSYGHDWPSAEQVLYAFDWLQLEAYRMKIVPSDPCQQKIIFQKYVHYAEELEQAGSQLRAFEEYQRILRNFSQFFNLDSIKTRLKLLEQSRTYKKHQKDLDKTEILEDSLYQYYATKLREDLLQRNTKASNWWHSNIHRYQKKIEKAGSFERAMIKRLLFNISAMAYSWTTDPKIVNSIPMKILCLDICIQIQPEIPTAYFMQMQNYLVINKPESALIYLDRLLKSGFTNKEYIRQCNEIEPLRKFEQYKMLMAD